MQVSHKADDLVRREVLYNILSWDISKNLIRVSKFIRTCLIKTYIKVCSGKHLCGARAIQDSLKRGDEGSEMNGKMRLLGC